jgi:hypothetical protein
MSGANMKVHAADFIMPVAAIYPCRQRVASEVFSFPVVNQPSVAF